MLKVAIDKNPLVSGHKVRGVGRYTKEIITSLTKITRKDFVFKAVDFSKANLNKYDVIHVPFFNPIVSELPECDLSKVVVTIHDLIPLIYPNVYQSGFGGKLNLIKQKKLLRKVAAIITPSETSKKDIVRFLSVDSKRVHPVYEANKEMFKKLNNPSFLETIRSKYKLPQKFVLYVGDINFNKNIPTLVEACRIAGTKLVICGKQALDIDDFGLDLMNLKGPRDWIRFLFNKPHPEISHHGVLGEKFRNNKDILRLGYVSDRDLLGIFNLATVYVQPSFYEGFGLSVLESMACGTAVIVSRTNALVEVSGGASLISDPNDPKDMAKNITKVMKDQKLRNQLIKKGFNWVSNFSWKKTAKETLEVYKTVLQVNSNEKFTKQ